VPPRWITEEDWLRTAGAPGESSHVPPERSPAAVGVQPPQEPSPQKELSGAAEGTRKRFRILTAAVAVGGLGLILATMFYTFGVVDQRALQAFKAPPRMIQPETSTETVGSAAASPAVSDPMPVAQQTAAGQTTRMPPDPMLNTQQSVHRSAHHSSKTHRKRFARGQHSGGSSLAFFPFR